MPYEGYDDMTASLARGLRGSGSQGFNDMVGLSQLDVNRAKRQKDMQQGNLIGQGVGGVLGGVLGGGPAGAMAGSQVGGMAGSAVGSNWNQDSFIGGLKNKEMAKYGNDILSALTYAAGGSNPVGWALTALANKDQAQEFFKDPWEKAKSGVSHLGDSVGTGIKKVFGG